MNTDNTASPATPPPVVRPRKGHQRIVLLSVAILSISGFFVFQRGGGGGGKSGGTKKDQSARAAQSVPITVATAQKGDIGDYVNALGYVTPISTITVRSRVDGELMSVKYREGEMVRTGDVLAEIDPQLFQAQLLQSQGQYERDTASLNQSIIDLARFKEAYARNAIPKQTLDIQQSTVYQNQAIIKIDKAQIDTARVNLQYCTITSPITGRVGLRLLDAGNIVHAADANGIVVITQLQPITVVFSVAQDFLPQIQSQLRLGHNLPVDALDRAQLTKLGSGTVTAIDNQIDATTGTVRIRATFANGNNALFPNQFVNANLLIRTLRNVTLIPTPAIQRNGDKAFVYVLQPDQTVKIRNVTVGISHEDVTAVDGVNPGEVVATDGFDKLQDGVKVTVRQPGNAPGNPSDNQQGGGTPGESAEGGSPPSGTKPEPGKQQNQPNTQQSYQSSGQQGSGKGPGGQK